MAFFLELQERAPSEAVILRSFDLLTVDPVDDLSFRELHLCFSIQGSDNGKASYDEIDTGHSIADHGLHSEQEMRLVEAYFMHSFIFTFR